jgi:hypothetical protein
MRRRVCLAFAMASLALTAAAPPPAASRLDSARSGLHAQVSAIQAGQYPPSAAEDRWLKARDQASDPLVRDLFARVFLDQWLMRFDPGLEGADGEAFAPALGAEKDRVIADNAAWLRGAMARIGWFDISKYGPEASQGAWLLVQHADRDPAWQRTVLADLAPRVKRGDMQGSYFAYLTDRVAVNAGQPQVYGTQGGCHGPGATWRQKPVADPEGLEARRAEVGLEPSPAYLAKFTCR